MKFRFILSNICALILFIMAYRFSYNPVTVFISGVGIGFCVFTAAFYFGLFSYEKEIYQMMQRAEKDLVLVMRKVNEEASADHQHELLEREKNERNNPERPMPSVQDQTTSDKAGARSNSTSGKSQSS